jgi:nitroimidazol reductase NimA-like FMN-containing flavoprotein (pyridoxamine 5'-phosphate oxidase superfamily)
MRRSEREITDRSEIDRIIGCAQVCRLGLSNGTTPYIVPVSFGYDGESIYFHSAKSGMKLDFLRANPNVCFEFEGPVEVLADQARACDWGMSFESVVGWGLASELSQRPDKIAALSCIMRRHSPDKWTYDLEGLERVSVWRVQVLRVTGKRSPRIDPRSH